MTTPPDTDPRRPPAWLPRALVMAVVAVFVGLLAWRALGRLGSVLTILVVSWFVSLAIEPPVAWLVRRGGLRRTRATGLVMIGTLVVITAGLGVFGQLFITQLIDLVQSVPALYGQLREFLDGTFGVALPESDEIVRRVVSTWGDDVAVGIIGVGGSILGGLFTSSAVLLVVYYMVSAGPRFRAAVCRPLEPARQREVLRLWEISQQKISEFISSRILLAALSTICTFVFLSIVRVPYALPLAAFTGLVSQFVPTIGTYIGGALPVAVGLTRSPLTGLGVVIFIVLYQQVENLVIAPKVSQHSLALNPAIAFLSVLAFGATFGALGAFLALPVAATIQAVSATYVRRHELIDSELLRPEDAPDDAPDDAPSAAQA